MGADDARVACPLFQAEYGGASPTSALQLRIGRMEVKDALVLNRKWHSRLPRLTNWQACEAFSAEFGNVYYAVALWGPPVTRLFNGKGYYELRRMAIAPDAPPLTASRMLRIMRLLIHRERPDVVKFISYQDTEVHKGTIYKADNWKAVGFRKGGAESWTSNGRERNACPASGDKVRWEYDVKKGLKAEGAHV